MMTASNIWHNTGTMLSKQKFVYIKNHNCLLMALSFILIPSINMRIYFVQSSRYTWLMPEGISFMILLGYLYTGILRINMGENDVTIHKIAFSHWIIKTDIIYFFKLKSCGFECDNLNRKLICSYFYLNCSLTPNTKLWSLYFSPNMKILPASALCIRFVSRVPNHSMIEAPQGVFKMMSAMMNCRDIPQYTACQLTYGDCSWRTKKYFLKI